MGGTLKLYSRARTGALLAGGVLALATTLATQAPADAASTLVVGSCSGGTYATINAAVAVAQPGDTIQVCPGVYHERVVVDVADLTFLGGQAGIDARTTRPKGTQTTISNHDGDFVLTGNANGTTINGFVLTGSNDVSADAVEDFAGASGLTLVYTVLELNSNGLNFHNTDASMPALVQYDKFNNNSVGANNPGSNGEDGTGVFITNGPADNTQIVDNAFSKHTQTAINFAGDSSNPSVGLVVSDNKSTDDSTFVVATNSTGAVIDHNNVVTHDANVPYGFGHGTGILDFGNNTDLRIASNVVKSVGGNVNGSSGISVSNYAGSSTRTNVTSNTINGYYNDLKIVSGNTSAYAADNKLQAAQNDGIIVQSNVSGVVISHNTVSTAAHYSCEDATTGSGTAGTANTWRTNHGGGVPSSPAGICP